VQVSLSMCEGFCSTLLLLASDCVAVAVYQLPAYDTGMALESTAMRSPTQPSEDAGAYAWPASSTQGGLGWRQHYAPGVCMSTSSSWPK
jgi:hypothetical protein